LAAKERASRGAITDFAPAGSQWAALWLTGLLVERGRAATRDAVALEVVLSRVRRRRAVSSPLPVKIQEEYFRPQAMQLALAWSMDSTEAKSHPAVADDGTRRVSTRRPLSLVAPAVGGRGEQHPNPVSFVAPEFSRHVL
jgi:hypothetical protein